jgi:hypothetical protein
LKIGSPKATPNFMGSVNVAFATAATVTSINPGAAPVMLQPFNRMLLLCQDNDTAVETTMWVLWQGDFSNLPRDVIVLRQMSDCQNIVRIL